MMHHTDRKGEGDGSSAPHRRHYPRRQHTGGMPDPMFQQTFTIPS